MLNSSKESCPDLKKVLAECRRWGVSIERRERIPRRYQSPASDRVGLCHARNLVFVAEAEWDNPLVGADILHEMSHVIQPLPPGSTPEDEVISGMLAVEHEAARRLELSHWEEWMAPFQISAARYEFTSWDEATDAEKKRALRLSLRGAKKKKLLGPDGKPTYQTRNRHAVANKGASRRGEE